MIDINEMSIEQLLEIAGLELWIWSSSCGRVELAIKRDDAIKGYHSGQCDDDIQELLTVPYIKKQLSNIPADALKSILAEYSNWNTDNHTDNMNRILWLACGDIKEAY